MGREACNIARLVRPVVWEAAGGRQREAIKEKEEEEEKDPSEEAPLAVCVCVCLCKKDMCVYFRFR